MIWTPKLSFDVSMFPCAPGIIMHQIILCLNTLKYALLPLKSWSRLRKSVWTKPSLPCLTPAETPQVIIAVMKHHSQKQLEEEKVRITVHQQKQSGQELKQAGTWRQELMLSPWRGAAYWLTPHGLFSLLSCSIQDHQPRGAPLPIGWLFLHQSQILKLPYRLACRPIVRR